MRRLSSATRTMKNSSRLELKIERNLTRSSKGTLGSCASSSTRRLNSSHDSSRLMNASGPISPSTVERFVEQEPVAHPSGADDEVEISAEEHGLLDDHGAGENDVHPLRFEPPDLPSLPRGEPLQALPDRRDVGLPHLQAVAMLALAPMRPEMNTGEGPHRPSQSHHDLPAPRRRQRLLKLPANLRAKRLDFPRARPLVLEEERCGAYRTQRQTRHGHNLPIAHPAQLEARAAQVRHHAVPEGQAVQCRVNTEARLVSRTAEVATATTRGPQESREYRAKNLCTALSDSSIASRRRMPGRPLPSRVGTRSSTNTR